VAADWLAIHTANCWGHDKKPFDFRIKWVWDNADLFKAIAKDPLGYSDWKKADSPWEFLAAAIEVGEFLDQGYGYVSRTPVGQDASNQGLQIYSLLLRDEESARNTNVIGSDTPQDLYATVAQGVMERLRVSDHKYAKGWLGFGINRATCKRQAMVLVYGSTKQSCKEYTIDWFQEMLTRRGVENPFEEVFRPCIYLSDLIWDSIGDVVTSARVGMDWLRDIARVCMQHEVKPMWTTPTGFLVQQRYEKQDSYEVKTSIGDTIRRHRLQFGRGEVSPRKNVNGICPNFVHSLDAALKNKTVNLCASLGVTQFANVHDSYATTAASSKLLAESLRKCTVEMFEENLLETFQREIQIQLPPDAVLPEIPPMGSLDIRCVLESDYYFA
jgi:DNA-directed RNA polymerase